HERGRWLRRHRPHARDVPEPVVSAFDTIVHLVYLGCATAFVIGLHLMNAPAKARRGNQVSAAGMGVAILTTVLVLIDGGRITAYAAGGGAAALIALGEHPASTQAEVTGVLDVLIGALTFSGSLIASGKLAGR